MGESGNGVQLKLSARFEFVTVRFVFQAVGLSSVCFPLCPVAPLNFPISV